MSNKLFYGALATAKQVTLLKAERIARMLDCDTAEEAFKLAQEGGFGGASTTIDQAVNYERKALSEFILKECPSDKLKKYLLARFDFLNCEVAIKAKYLGFDAKSMMVDYGFYSVDLILDCVDRCDYTQLPQAFANALTTADKLFEENMADGFVISNLFTKAQYEYLAKLSKFTFFEQDLKNRIDCVNILTALRCEGDDDLLNQLFLEGGKLPKSKVEILLTKDFGSVIKEFMFEKTCDFINIVIKDAMENRPPIMGEAYCDSIAIKRMRENRFDLSAEQEFYLYWLYKQSQITNVNVIVVGKLSNADKSEIKMRLRESYEN